MRRIFLTAAASSALAFAAPGVALAHDGEHQQGEHRQGEEHHRHNGAHDARAGERRDISGTVASFTNGVLTIARPDGSMISGKVTQATRIECRTPTPTPAASASDNRDQDRGDDNGVDGEENHGGPGPGRGDRDDNDNDANDRAEHCTPAALVVGAAVREAELSVGQLGAVWEKVELNR